MRAEIIIASLSFLVPCLAKAETPLPKVPETARWRSARPAKKAPPTPVLPAFEQTKLANGLTILVAEVRTLPLVSFALVTKGGATLDPSGGAGLTAITYAMLEEGSGDLSALQFSDAVADLGAAFGSSCGRDRGAVTIGGLKRNADSMMALMRDALLKPKFEQKDFERRQQQTIAALERRRGSPMGLAFEALPAVIYGPEHPYGHPPTGTLNTVPKLKLDDVKAHHARTFGPARSVLIAAGYLSLAETKALAEKHLGDWTTETKELQPIPPLEARKRSEILLIQKDNSPQTMVIIGRPLFGRGHPDQQTMTVLNDVYGGNFSSRLNMNLREDKGYTYGAHSQASYRKGVGVFVAYAALKQDVTDKGLNEFFLELEKLKTHSPTEEEVTRAKSGIIRSLPGSFETTTAMASAAATIFVYGLPLDYYAKLPAKTSAVDLSGVNRAVGAYLDPGVMQVLMVGDAPKIQKGLEALKLGPIQVRKIQ